MLTVEYIVVHCSDSEWGSVNEIRKWHIARGFSDCGYHFVILNGHITQSLTIPCLCGSIEIGRPIDQPGAHCPELNKRSLAVCGVCGSSGWHPTQEASLRTLLRQLRSLYGVKTDNIIGHNETESGKAQRKTCPNLPMDVVRGLLGPK